MEGAGILVLPEMKMNGAHNEIAFEAALIKAMTESMATVPLIVHGDSEKIGCITWAQHRGSPRWRVEA